MLATGKRFSAPDAAVLELENGHSGRDSDYACLS
jgi:hypothetical protein